MIHLAQFDSRCQAAFHIKNKEKIKKAQSIELSLTCLFIP